MKKADAWVVLRIDGDVVELKDNIAVKGVYDSESAAESALQNLSEESNYIVIRSRRYLEDHQPEILRNNHSEKVQGLKIHSSNGHTNYDDLYGQFRVVRDLWNILPQSNRRKTIIPLLSQLAELAVAKVTGASIIDDPNLAANLKLPTGERVEVKTILLDSERRRSPNLQFPAEVEFDLLAVVIFSPDLTIETARMIPVEALKFYARSVSYRTGRPMLNLRVIQPFLDYPGSKDINLANYSLNVG
jgi:hypothetical protein